MQNHCFYQYGRYFAIIASILTLYLLPMSQSSHASENTQRGDSVELADGVALQQAYNKALENWAYVLSTYVDAEGRTDFQHLALDIQPLENMVAFIGSVSPATAPELFTSKQAVMAYYINSYNALAMYGVIEEGIPDGFTSFFSRAGFFKFRDVVIGGKTTNLYDYENDIIRPLNEPRVHFALNCMVKDCPRLPQQPFYPDTLDSALEKATYEFFAKEKHFYLDDKRKRVYVSAILDFYTEDFVSSGNKKDLPQYINQYLEQPIPAGYKVKYMDYDWHINAQPETTDPNGAVSQAGAAAPAGKTSTTMDNTVEQPLVLTSTPNQTTFLELYTSEGCSSCPPAEKWISGFVDSKKLWTELVPINFHVDYWDNLGWKDPFSNKAFSQRQSNYKQSGKANIIATPGFVLNGNGWNGWFRGQAIPQRVAPLSGELSGAVANQSIDVSFDNVNVSPVQSPLIVHAALLGFGIESFVGDGENAGRKLAHDFVVIGYENQRLSNESEHFYGQLPLPVNPQIDTTRKALILWVSQSTDPTPIQVAASWWG
ncbi:DUF1223 domain-containing protein [Alteromonas sp. C1M14]|uniref:DUF1223 domain-containing protein n=1 Tax=Alteromonas sp. C1M14 TaxID=2841567 RepID=UPI001C088C4F|nr:DUF1223 domain-containing protein [Alteromonas sp. C1M14]MBU2976837.1 DUF1223 domain-containing protein [Alteromonas sp. C1M14]